MSAEMFIAVLPVDVHLNFHSKKYQLDLGYVQLWPSPTLPNTMMAFRIFMAYFYENFHTKCNIFALILSSNYCALPFWIGM